MKKITTIIISLMFTLTLGVFAVGCSTAPSNATPAQSEKYTEGLRFIENVEGTGYEVCGIGEVESRSIVIPSKYNGLPVTGIAKRAFENETLITKIIIPNSVTSIGFGAFSGCNSLESITIPFVGAKAGVKATDTNQYPFGYIFGTSDYIDSTATEQEYYGSSTSISTTTTYYIPTSLTSVTVTGGDILPGAFYGCGNLTSVTIGNSVTSLGDGVFYGCSNLTSVTIPDSVTSLGDGVFYGCSSLTSVTIPDNVTSLSYGAFYNCSSLTSVKIGNSVTSIGDYAFGYCSSLTSITIPDSVTSIGECAFEYCSSLTSVTIPDSVTSIGECAFEYCSSLTSISMSNNVTSLGDAVFYGCSSIESVIIPDGVTSLGDDVFYECGSLTSVTIPNSVTSIGISVLYGCSSLESITIPFVGAKAGVKDTDTYQYPFGYLFGTSRYTGSTATEQYYYGSSTSYTTYSTYYIPSSLTSVTVTGDNILFGAFLNCSNLTSVTIGNGVTSIGDYAFSECESLTSVTIGNGVTSIGEEAFSGCISLTSITIPDSVTSIGGWLFYYCDNLTSINVDEDNQNYTSIDGNLYSKDGKKLVLYAPGMTETNITIPDSVTSIGDNAFSSCSSLTSITIPDSVTSIGECAFSGCFRLESITIPFVGEKAEVKVTDTYQYPFGYIFGSIDYIGSKATEQYYYGSGITGTTYYIPSSLTSVTVTGGKIPYGAFYNCSSLTSIAVGNSVTSIGRYAFYNCSSLTSITIPDSVTSMGDGAFSGCKSLESLKIPFVGAKAGVKETDTYQYPFGYIFGIVSYTGGIATSQSYYGSSTSRTTNTTYYVPSSLENVTITGGNILYNAFSNCGNLTRVTIGNNVTSIGSYAFSNCSSLTSVAIGKYITSIGGYAFSGCDSLTRVTINGGNIMPYAFSNCGSLTNLTLANGVTSIGSGAFFSCSSLTHVTIPNSVTIIGNNAFDGCTALTSITFKNTSGWMAGLSSLNSADLANTSTAATYLTSTYYSYTWTRS